MEGSHRFPRENEFLFSFGGLRGFLFTYRLLFLILCLGRDKNSLTLWELVPYCVGIHLGGRSFPRRCASFLQIIEPWLSIVGQFEGHQPLEAVGAALCYQLVFPVCAWWRVSREHCRAAEWEELLCSGNKAGLGGATEAPLPHWRWPVLIKQHATTSRGSVGKVLGLLLLSFLVCVHVHKWGSYLQPALNRLLCKGVSVNPYWPWIFFMILSPCYVPGKQHSQSIMRKNRLFPPDMSSYTIRQ